MKTPEPIKVGLFKRPGFNPKIPKPNKTHQVGLLLETPFFQPW